MFWWSYIYIYQWEIYLRMKLLDHSIYCEMYWSVLLLFSHAVMSDSLPPHGLKHSRLLSFIIPQNLLKLMSVKWWFHSTISSSVVPFSHLPSVFPSIRVFSNELALHIRWPRFEAVASVLPMNIQGLFSLGLTGSISLQSRGVSRVFSSNSSKA